MSNSVIEEAKDKSIELLHNLKTDQGFVASTVNIDNYKRVWGRDGVIAGLAALETGDSELVGTFKQTLRTLKKYQDKTGRIVSNVSLDGQKISYGTTVGRIDATIWFIIAVCKFSLKTGEQSFWQEFEESVRKAVFYLNSLELNGRGLIYIPAGGDWADEYINEGYVLFDQCLYAWALHYFHKISGDQESGKKYKRLIKLIEVNYFPSEENKESEFVYHRAIFSHACEKYVPPLPITSFTPFDVLHLHDLFATSLLLSLFVGNNKEEIEKHFQKSGFLNNFPILPAFEPVIDEEHHRWEDLKHNHLFRFKNKPYEFHNGGLWPLVHGWFLASKTELDEEDVLKFAEVLKRDDYVFPEFYKGDTFEPAGTMNLGFSVAGYLMAYNRLKTGKKPFEL